MSTKQLTARQAEVLAWINKFKAEKGYSPTRKEIAEGMGFKSANAAEDHLQALAAKGALRITPGIARGIVIDPSLAQPKQKARVTS